MKTVMRWFSLLIILLTASPIHGLAAQQDSPSSAIVVNTLVDGFNNDGYCSLREAIAAADLNSPQYGCPGGENSHTDTITFAVDGTIFLTDPLPVVLDAGPLVIDGGVDNDIVINGTGFYRIFEVMPGAVLTLKNLTMFNGSAGEGGHGAGLYNNGGTVNIEGCTFNLNTVTGLESSGGGLYNTDGEVTIRDSTFAFNEAHFGGGVYCENGIVEIYDSEFTLNEAHRGGGVAGGYDNSSLKIWNTEFNFNDAFDGGGLDIRGDAWVYSSTFYYNEAGGKGGGINVGFLDTVIISDTVFTHNKADQSGGGLHSDVSYITIDSCEFMTNTATNGGAIGILDYGTLRLRDREVPDNQVGHGGVIDYSHSFAPLLIQDSLFWKNSADYGGGLIVDIMGIIVDSEFRENTATSEGGAIHNNIGPLGIVNSTISENTAGWGAGIYSYGIQSVNTLVITNSTLYSNSAAFMGNSLYNSYDSSGPGMLRVHNSIVADNDSVTNCVGPITDGGHNLDTGTTCGFSSENGSLNNTDPLLGPLALNTSPKLSKTHALLLGSPAINQADPALCPVDDQRGFPRRVGYCDIGAYEAQLASVTALSGSGQSTLVLADFPNPLQVELEDQYGNHLGGVQVTFTGPASGAGISNSGSVMTSDQTGIVVFTATATANVIAGGPYQVEASSGEYQVNFSLTNLPYDSATQITSDAPDPSFAGETFTVQFKVTSGQGSPPGSVTVTVSGRSEKCAGQLSGGQGACSLSIPTPGEYTLVATYGGSSPYPASSDAEAHTVRAAGIGDFQLFLPLVMYTPEQPFR